MQLTKLAQEHTRTHVKINEQKIGKTSKHNTVVSDSVAPAEEPSSMSWVDTVARDRWQPWSATTAETDAGRMMREKTRDL
eukprot:6326967-Amphidinium_carterae.1